MRTTLPYKSCSSVEFEIIKCTLLEEHEQFCFRPSKEKGTSRSEKGKRLASVNYAFWRLQLNIFKANWVTERVVLSTSLRNGLICTALSFM